MAFIFGGNTNLTYDQVQKQREVANALLQANGQTPRNVGEGLSAIGRALAARAIDKRAGRAEDKLRGEFDAKWAGLFGGQGAYPSGASGAGYASAQPVTPSAFETPNPGNLPQATIDAVNRVSPNVPPDFAKIEAAYNLPAGYLAKTAEIESGGNPNAQNPNSSAGGMFQFIDSTAKQYGLTDKTDPYAAADAAARFAADNMAYLTKALGRTPTAGELYLAHQQGAAGAAKLLSNPNAPAASLVGPEATRLNGGGADMTAGDFAGQWTGKFGGQPQGMDIGALAALAGDPMASPAQKAVIQAMIQQQMQAADPMRQIEMQKAQIELAQLQNPQGKPPELDTFTGPDGTVYSLNRLTGETKPLTGSRDPAAGAGEFGLNPVFGRDADGNVIVMQLGKNGQAVATKLPDGITPDLGVKSEEIARGTATGKASGEAIAAVPGAEVLMGQLDDQIGALATDPYLGRMLGPVDSRLPNLSADAARVQSKMDQLKGGAFLQAFNVLRGGGQITEVEGQKATDAMARMNAAQSEADYKRALYDFQDAVKNGIEKLQAVAGASVRHGPEGAGAPSPGAATMRYNPTTGKIEPIQ